MQRQVVAELARAAGRGSGRRFVAVATASAAGAGGPDAVLLLHREAGPADILQGYCAALMLAWQAQLDRGGGLSGQWPAATRRTLADPDVWLDSCGSRSAGGSSKVLPAASSGGSGAGASGGVAAGYGGFLDALAAAGWDLERVALLQSQARLVWGSADLRSE